MMELDKAIRHAEEVAEQSEEDAKALILEGWQSGFKNLTPEKEAEFFTERVKLSDGCVKCAEEHRQLAEWLKELKRVREQPRLKELKRLREQKRQHGEWIPCSERLPEMNKKVLCACIANIYEVLELRAIGWFYDNAHIYMKGFVLAWMPLPEPYKEEGEEQ